MCPTDTFSNFLLKNQLSDESFPADKLSDNKPPKYTILLSTIDASKTGSKRHSLRSLSIKYSDKYEMPACSNPKNTNHFIIDTPNDKSHHLKILSIYNEPSIQSNNITKFNTLILLKFFNIYPPFQRLRYSIIIKHIDPQTALSQLIIKILNRPKIIIKTAGKA